MAYFLKGKYDPDIIFSCSYDFFLNLCTVYVQYENNSLAFLFQIGI
jgi:hypothetical protein